MTAPTAAAPVAPAGHVEVHAAEFRFTVDGEDFPWHIVAAPQITELTPNLVAVEVSILCCGPELFTDCLGGQPVIGDKDGNPRRFPWSIHEHGVAYRRGRLDPPTATLTFLARTAFSHDLPITCLADDPAREACDHHGNVWHHGADR